MHLAFMLSTAFSLWMLVDAVQRGLGAKWGWIIMIPFGEFAYFFAVKIHDFSPGSAGPARLVQSGRRVGLPSLRARSTDDRAAPLSLRAISESRQSDVPGPGTLRRR